MWYMWLFSRIQIEELNYIAWIGGTMFVRSEVHCYLWFPQILAKSVNFNAKDWGWPVTILPKLNQTERDLRGRKKDAPDWDGDLVQQHAVSTRRWGHCTRSAGAVKHLNQRCCPIGALPLVSGGKRTDTSVSRPSCKEPPPMDSSNAMALDSAAFNSPWY